MAVPSGLGSQFGLVEEVTPGTAVTVTRFYPFISETVQQTIDRIEIPALRAGARTVRSDAWSAGFKHVGGDVILPVSNKGQGIIWKHSLGSIATTQPDVGSHPTVYDHTGTVGDLTGDSLTCQFGRPATDGTAHPFTYPGMKINAWRIGGTVGERADLTLTFLGMGDESTAISLATASYPAGLTYMTFVQGTLTVAGSAVNVRTADVGGDNMLSDDRRRFGSQTRLEPLETDFRAFDGTLDADFTALTAYNRFVNGTEAALVLLFEGATISGSYKFSTRLTCNVRFDGETPNVSGPEELRQPLPFKCVDTGSNDAITVLYRTTDATP